jgi:hypothetical protein
VTRNAKRLFLYVCIVALTFGAATVMLSVRAARLTKIIMGNTTQAMDGDAAFRDGLFLGKLDAESGRKPHLSIGRWNTARDRASFVAGYQQGYRQVQGVKIGE